MECSSLCKVWAIEKGAPADPGKQLPGMLVQGHGGHLAVTLPLLPSRCCWAKYTGWEPWTCWEDFWTWVPGQWVWCVLPASAGEEWRGHQLRNQGSLTIQPSMTVGVAIKPAGPPWTSPCPIIVMLSGALSHLLLGITFVGQKVSFKNTL